MSGYAIVCNARMGQSLGVSVLALVDRAKTKERWWTSDDSSLAIRYESESAARFACRRLKRNKPRVVPFQEAADQLNRQGDDISWNEAMSGVEACWDGHKEVF